MPTLSGHPPPLSPFRYSFCLEYFKKVYLFHEWTHLPTAFVICLLWISSNKVFSTCPPAILRASNQHLKCIHMESISTQMYYFPFSAIIWHLPKILPILSKKQEGLAMLAALNLCLQNTFKAKAKQTQLWWSVSSKLFVVPTSRMQIVSQPKRKTQGHPLHFHITFTHITHFHLNINYEST